MTQPADGSPSPDWAGGEPRLDGSQGALAGSAAPATRPATSLGRASAIMAMGSLASKILGMVRTSMLAGALGVVAAADAFGIANTAPNIIFTLLNGGVLNAVLIPQITKAMKRPDGGRDFVDRLLTAAFAAIALVTVLAIAATPWVVDVTSSLQGAPLHLAVLFGYLTLPQIFFYGVYAVLGNVLNARDQFAAFMWAPALANVVQITGLAAFLVQWGKHDSALGWTMPMIWTLAGTATLGIIAQAFVLIPPLVKGGFRWRPRWGLRGQGMGAASRMLGWTLTALVIAQAGGIVVSNALTSLNGPGRGGVERPGYAAYNNALMIFFLPHGLLTVSILTALFPRMTRVWNDRDVKGLRALVVQGLTVPAVGIIPATALIVALAHPIVQAIFPGLRASEVDGVARSLQLMSLGLLAFGISTLQQRYSFAREEGRQNLAYQVLLSVVQVGFALAAWFLVPPRWGLATVSLGLAVSNWMVSIVFIAVANRQLGGMGLGRVLGLWTRLLIASAAGAGTAWLVSYGMTMFRPGWVMSVLVCVLGGIAFGLVFLAGAKLLRILEVDELTAPIRRRLPF